MSLLAETDKAIAAASHLQDDSYLGAIEALRMLAAKADAWQVIVEWAREDLEGQDGRRRPAVPANDNVTLSSYARLASELGLTPAGRKDITGVGAARVDRATGPTAVDTPGEEGSAPRGKVGRITPLPGSRVLGSA